MEKAYSRSDRLLRKKFFQYLLPTMITYAALSLGRRDHETAGKSLTAAITGGLVSGLILLLVGNVFFRTVIQDALS